MFSVGIGEPLDSASVPLVRHCVVWLGGSCDEDNRGIPESHPLCSVILRILVQFKFAGTWLVCKQAGSLRQFELKSLLWRLARAQWIVDPEQSACIRGHRVVSEKSPWPYVTGPALPRPQSEFLIIGGSLEYSSLDRRIVGPSTALPGEDLVLGSDIARWLVDSNSLAVYCDRTQTEHSPGISIISPPGLVDPEAFVPKDKLVAVHRDNDARRAWSYGRFL